ncbi:hypothetical protein CE91St56_37900 [Lachnospiraceae bacterium]|nr:hypothetical protein CE91St56_37900 [Lachnospiraceae bacterium]GKH42739.1 hypothetical protein CE91St57_37130 [Lachnospiraceae bacterium]
MWSASTWRASALAPKLFPGCLCGKLFSSHSPFPETYDEEPFFLIVQETEEEIQKNRIAVAVNRNSAAIA